MKMISSEEKKKKKEVDDVDAKRLA